MKCPRCEAWTEVLETRKLIDHTYRRYLCANNHRFSTAEMPVPDGRKTSTKQLLQALKLAAKAEMMT